MAKYTTHITEAVNGYSCEVHRMFTLDDQRQEFEHGIVVAAKQAAIEMRKEKYQEDPAPKTNVPNDLSGLYIFTTAKELHAFLQRLYLP